MEKTKTECPEIPAWFRGIFRELVIAKQPRDLDRDALRVYFKYLNDYPQDQVVAAAEALARSGDKFFPSTSEWINAIHEQRRLLVPVETAADIRRRMVDPTDPPISGDDPRLHGLMDALRRAALGDREGARRAVEILNTPIRTFETPRRSPVIIDENDPVVQRRREEARAQLEVEAQRRGMTVEQLKAELFTE